MYVQVLIYLLLLESYFEHAIEKDNVQSNFLLADCMLIIAYGNLMFKLLLESYLEHARKKDINVQNMYVQLLWGTIYVAYISIYVPCYLKIYFEHAKFFKRESLSSNIYILAS